MSHFLSNDVFWVCQPIMMIQTSMLSYRDQLKSWNVGVGKYEYLIYYLGNVKKSRLNCVGYFSGKLKLRHIYGTAGTHRRLNLGT